MLPEMVRRTVLNQELKERHVNMQDYPYRLAVWSNINDESRMAFTSTIGFGLFLKAGTVIYLAGPGLGTLSMFISCTIMWSVIAAIGEMTALFPVQGPLFEFPCRFIDEGVGFAVGWMAWFAWVATIAAELVAVTNLFTFNFPTEYLRSVGYPQPTLEWATREDSPALWITIFLAVILIVNMIPVGYYGELEYVFGSFKMIFIIGLIMMNVVLSATQKVQSFSKGDHFWTWDRPYGFASEGITVRGIAEIKGNAGQFLAFWSALTSVCWSLVGFETIGVTAAENRDLERWETMRLASKKLFMRITMLYTLATFVASLNVPMDDAQLAAIYTDSRISGQHSIFVLAAVRNHLIGWPSFFNGFFIFSALTSAVNAVYVSSRLLHALASIPEVWPRWAQPIRKRLERTSAQGIPFGTVAISWLFGLLAFLAIQTYPSVILSRITTNATVSFFIVYGVVCASYIPFYRQIKTASEDPTMDNKDAYNRDDEQYPYRTHGQLFRSWYGLTFCALIVIFNGWQSFLDPFSLPDFIVSYIGIAAFFAIIAFYHMRTDGIMPWKWRRHASLQILRPPPKIVVTGRRRGILHLPNEKRLLAAENFEAVAIWLWCWLK